jgi:hypothetical protein
MIDHDCESAAAFRIHGPDWRQEIRVVTRRPRIAHAAPD